MISWSCPNKERAVERLNLFVPYSNSARGQAALEASKDHMCGELAERLGREMEPHEQGLLYLAFFQGIGHGFRTCVDAQLELEARKP